MRETDGRTYERSIRTRLPTVLGTAAVALCSLAPPPAAAQQSGPLLKADLIRIMVASAYTPEELTQIVRMSCVAFHPTKKDREDLGRLPGGRAVLPAIDRCLRKGRPVSSGYRRGIPQALPVAVMARNEIRTDPVELDETQIPREQLDRRPELDVPRFSIVVPQEKLVLAATEIPPRLLNWDDVARRLLDEYRPDRRQKGTVVLRLHVEPDGSVTSPRVRSSSGDPTLDAAVLASAPVMRFLPAMSRDRKVASWTELPIRFETP